MDGPDGSRRVIEPSDRERKMGEDFTSNFLEHHGVKGMKWGIRKKDSGSDGGQSAKPPASEDVQKVDAHKALIKAGGTRALSNKELKEVVDRMNLEQQFAQLKLKQPNRFNQGHDEVKKILALGDTISKAHTFAKGPVGKMIRKAIVGV